MLILSIDSAGGGCAAGVWRDGVMLAQMDEPMERGQDRRLLPLIQELLEKAAIGFADLTRIAVTTGPGSFTGLRIGLAAATGLGFALGKPVIGIDRFRLYRFGFAATVESLTVIDSRRAELYCQHRHPGGTGAPVMLIREQIADWLIAHPAAIVTGDAAAAALPNYNPPPISLVEACAHLGALAAERDPAYAPRPLYIRPPDVTFAKTGTKPAAKTGAC